MPAEPTEEEILAQARVCPVIKAAYATDDPDVIRRIEAIHPPSCCQYVTAGRRRPP